MTDFRSTHPFDKRRNEAVRIMSKYPDRIPIIVEMAKKCTLPSLDKNKFLVPRDITIGQFLFVIRKRIKLTPEEAMFIFIREQIPKTSDLLAKLYDTNKEDDGFLYVTIHSENCFG